MSGQLNVRPGARTLEQVEELSALYNGSTTAVIRIAVDRMHAQEIGMELEMQDEAREIIAAQDAEEAERETAEGVAADLATYTETWDDWAE